MISHGQPVVFAIKDKKMQKICRNDTIFAFFLYLCPLDVTGNQIYHQDLVL